VNIQLRQQEGKELGRKNKLQTKNEGEKELEELV